MSFLTAGLPAGRYFGIAVRLHWTFLAFAFYRISEYASVFNSPLFAVAMVAGLYLSVLLHEFGHALMARWCDGDVDLIVLWPLGGLAFCRPVWHPTAHLLTTVAGPAVTLLLWLGLSLSVNVLPPLDANTSLFGRYAYAFVLIMGQWNKLLLLFNLIPAFPMDGGRILRDGLWHFMDATRATLIAVRASQVIAIAAIVWALSRQDYWLAILAGFILLQAGSGHRAVGLQAGGVDSFSVRERLARGRLRFK